MTVTNESSLKEIKEHATETLGLSADQVREFGKLTMKDTWLTAIASVEKKTEEIVKPEGEEVLKTFSVTHYTESVEEFTTTKTAEDEESIFWDDILDECPYLVVDMDEFVVTHVKETIRGNLYRIEHSHMIRNPYTVIVKAPSQDKIDWDYVIEQAPDSNVVDIDEAEVTELKNFDVSGVLVSYKPFSVEIEAENEDAIDIDDVYNQAPGETNHDIDDTFEYEIEEIGEGVENPEYTLFRVDHMEVSYIHFTVTVQAKDKDSIEWDDVYQHEEIPYEPGYELDDTYEYEVEERKPEPPIKYVGVPVYDITDYLE